MQNYIKNRKSIICKPKNPDFKSGFLGLLNFFGILLLLRTNFLLTKSSAGDKITIVINNICYFWKDMPAKKLITRDFILGCALELVRENGMDSLNMRTLAKRCGCSTQPIYLSFSGSDELRSALNAEILKVYDKFMRDMMASGKYPEYKSIGMGYIDFARRERELFKYLFMRDRSQESGIGEDAFDKDAMSVMKNLGLYGDEARRLHAEMWVFVHGIATMYATEYLDWEWEMVSDMLTDVYRGLCAVVKKDSE